MSVLLIESSRGTLQTYSRRKRLLFWVPVWRTTSKHAEGPVTTPLPSLELSSSLLLLASVFTTLGLCVLVAATSSPYRSESHPGVLEETFSEFLVPSLFTLL
jgi:hypothetical protein